MDIPNPSDIKIPEEIHIKSEILLEEEDAEEILNKGIVQITSLAYETINGVPVRVTNEIKLKDA